MDRIYLEIDILVLNVLWYIHFMIGSSPSTLWGIERSLYSLRRRR